MADVLNDNESSVLFYAKGTLVYDVFFPEGHVDCRHCPYCWYSEPFGLFRCRITNGFIEKNELNRLHDNCPIQFEETPF